MATSRRSSSEPRRLAWVRCWWRSGRASRKLEDLGKRPEKRPFRVFAPAPALPVSLRRQLQQDLGCDPRVAALVHQLDGLVQVCLEGGRDLLGERQRIAGLDQDVQAPGLDFGPLAPLVDQLGGVSHGARVRGARDVPCVRFVSCESARRGGARTPRRLGGGGPAAAPPTASPPPPPPPANRPPSPPRPP